MHAASFLRHRRTQALVESLAGEIATAARHRVRCRVEDRSRGMSLNVLRGYVRARAALPVHEQVRARHRSLAELSSPAQQKLVRQATERAVHLVVRDLAGLEISHPAHRKAA